MNSYLSLLVDSVEYQQYKEKNKYNEKVWSPVEVKRCFKTQKTDVVLNNEAEKIVSRLQVFTDNTFEPKPFDKFDGLEVISVEPITGLLIRKPIGYKVYL